MNASRSLLKELEATGSQTEEADSVSPGKHLQQRRWQQEALVCESNAKIEQAVSSSLSKMGYSLDKVKSTKDALKKMEETTVRADSSGRIVCR